MDYEIDIEEHDVLENPFIKIVFPDISVIKKEITQYFEEGSNVQKRQELAEAHDDDLSRFNLKNNILGNFHASSEVEQALSICSSKIILGSKPNVDTQNETQKHISVSKPNANTQDDTKDNIIFDTHKPHSDKKFIFGSKPNKLSQNDIKINHGEKVKLKQIKVILQDIKSYLNQNGRYCKICCRLFLSKNALNNHQNRVHHKVIKNKYFTEPNNTTETLHKCIICGSYFYSKGNLHRHYRNIHQKKIKLKANNSKSKISNSYKTNTDDKINEVKSGTEKQQKTEKTELARKGNSNVSIYKDKGQDSFSKKIDKTNYDCSISLKVKPDVKVHEIKHKNNNKIKIASEKPTAENKTKDASTKKDNKSNYATRSQSYTCTDSNLCLHCKKVFPDQKSLIEHMYDILEPKKKTDERIKYTADSDMTKKEDEQLLFVCRQCSYYLPSFNTYLAHMTRNHKTVTLLDVKKEEYDPQCKYCSYKSSNLSTHNRHIHSYHIDLMFLRIENEIENAKNKQNNENITSNAINEFNSFALESVVFECNKCSICFLSSTISRNHKQHNNMELLNEWKCSICQHVFKEQYKELHLKQHAFSQPINVFKLNEHASSNVLYNCTKCAIHFTEKRYQEHFSNCGSDTTDSSYCMTCDILVDKAEMSHHKTQHEHLRDISDFTIIDSNVIVDIVTNLKRKGTDIECEVRPRKRLYEQHNCLTYCHTCKSFLIGLGLKNKRHIKGTCSRIPKYACNECGLIFTSSTLEIHKERHSKEKHLRLQDYKFFDLQGNQVPPPIPEYPYCKICKVHFLRKNALYRHICDETDYLTCDICDIKLAEKTFKLHMSFHFYVVRETSLPSVRCSPPNQSSNSDDSEHQIQQFLNIATTNNSNMYTPLSLKSNATESESKSHPKSELMTAKTEFKKTLSDKVEPKVQEKSNYLDDSIKRVVQKNNSTDIVEEQMPYDGFSVVLLYTCKTCDLSVDFYDEVVKHCQTHYSGKKNHNISPVTNCKKCSLKLHSYSYSYHQRRVHSSNSKIQVQKYDPSYFTSKNTIWVKHIFQNLPKEMVNELLKNSIYQHEHRIQLERIQKGSTFLYIYKCDSCGNFVDPESVYTHAESPCGKVRKHPCSRCGLPFISVFSRRSHENLHKQIKKSLTEKSFNIVLFNRSKDRALNKRIFCTTNQYLLYQCRNCDSVVEKSMLTDHVCDRKSLVKCLTCGLLISKDDFAAHLSKHTDLGNFYSENFKVILFGCKTSNSSDENVLKKLSSGFSGTVYDYTLYKCGFCQMCLKNNDSTEKHSCIPNFELDKAMCSECNLYFPSGNLKHHTKQHRIDPDFIKEHMNVITFSNHLPLPQTNASFDDKLAIKVSDSLSNIDKFKTGSKNGIDDDDDRDSANDPIQNSICIKKYDKQQDELITEKTIVTYGVGKVSIVNNFKNNEIRNDEDERNNLSDSYELNACGSGKSLIDFTDDRSKYDAMAVNKDVEILYRCNCGLHFLNQQKVIEHSKKCQPKAKQYKQACSKCHLLFNPNELFTHLVIHHRDKSQVQHFKVIELSLGKPDNAKNSIPFEIELNDSVQTDV